MCPLNCRQLWHFSFNLRLFVPHLLDADESQEFESDGGLHSTLFPIELLVAADLVTEDAGTLIDVLKGAGEVGRIFFLEASEDAEEIDRSHFCFFFSTDLVS